MIWVKRLLGLLVLLLVLHFFAPMVRQFPAAGEQFRAAHWGWFPVVILLGVLSYCSLGWLNMITLKPFGDHIGFWPTMAMLTAVSCAEVALPSAGASGVAVRARLLAKYHYSVEVSGFSLLIESVFLSIAMSVVAMLGCIYLYKTGAAAQRVAICVLVPVVAFALWAGWQVMFSPSRSARIVRGGAVIWNGLLGRWWPLDADTVAARAKTFQDGVAELRQVPRWRFFAAAYGRVLLDTLTLEAAFRMFGHPVPFDALLTGFGLIMVMSALAALPLGLGVADLSLPVVFANFGVPSEIALAAGLTYRLMAFWMPRFIGYVAWSAMERLPEPAPLPPAPTAVELEATAELADVPVPQSAK